MVHEDLTEEAIKAKGVKLVILGDIPGMGKARLVRMRRRVRKIEGEGE